MDDVLNNPVFYALLTRDRHLGNGNDKLRWFDEEVSPFAGFETGYKQGFEALYQMLPAERKILFATPGMLREPAGWQFSLVVEGLQFIFPKDTNPPAPSVEPVALNENHINEMVALAALTKPGPFAIRTIEFGSYHGIFHDGKLVAMTGQRLHPGESTEISAVCTHPEHLGKGYAAALLAHQLQLILSQGMQPFLHVRADNDRAIALYQRLGFKVSRTMNFYFMKKRLNRQFP